MPVLSLLAVVPFAAILVGAIFLNHATPFVFGLPLLLAWLILCILATSGIMGIIYLLDPSNRSGAKEGDG